MKGIEFMTKIKLADLKRELKVLDNKELINLITELYKQNKDVEQFLSNKFIGEEAIIDLYEKTKKKVEDEFFPKRGLPKLRLSNAKNEISNFKKISADEHKTVDLMLFFVENGTEFTNTYGDIDSKFYNSMITMYDKVVVECNKNEEFFNSFKDRLYSVVKESNGIGWGYHDCLFHIYYSLNYALEDEEE